MSRIFIKDSRLHTNNRLQSKLKLLLFLHPSLVVAQEKLVQLEPPHWVLVSNDDWLNFGKRGRHTPGRWGGRQWSCRSTPPSPPSAGDGGPLNPSTGWVWLQPVWTLSTLQLRTSLGLNLTWIRFRWFAPGFDIKSSCLAKGSNLGICFPKTCWC